MSEDVRQKGIVVEANGKRATVRFKKTDACGHCNACFRFGSNEADIEMDNTLGAKKGDEVAASKASRRRGCIGAALYFPQPLSQTFGLPAPLWRDICRDRRRCAERAELPYT